MWIEEKQRQFDALREKEFVGTLTVDEQQELNQFFAELDAEEAKMLRPAMERMEQERIERQSEIADLQQKNALLAKLAEQEEQLLQRARAVMQEVHNEQMRLRADYERDSTVCN